MKLIWNPTTSLPNVVPREFSYFYQNYNVILLRQLTVTLDEINLEIKSMIYTVFKYNSRTSCLTGSASITEN